MVSLSLIDTFEMRELLMFRLIGASATSILTVKFLSTIISGSSLGVVTKIGAFG
ncbi:MAG: hypothetical protein QXW41_08195 [Fervidicoccaceae archaeon]